MRAKNYAAPVRFESKTRRKRCGVALIVWFAAVIAALIAVPEHARAQGAPSCRDGKRLTLVVVEGYVQRKQDEVAMARIRGCHVGFKLDAAALQRLARLGISDAVMDALNKDTVAQMTAEEAHSEVAELQANPGDAQAGKVFQTRIDFLKNAEYTEQETFAYKDYEPRTQVMDAVLGSEEYAFRQVAPGDAQRLAAGPKGITIVRRFDDDPLQKRTVRLLAEHIEITGQSKRATIMQLAASALQRMRDNLKDGQNYWARKSAIPALASYQAASDAADDVLMADRVMGAPEDPEAKAGKAEAIAAMTKIASGTGGAAGNSNCKAGAWCDEKNGLMWTNDDNRKNVKWKDANNYCTALQRGGFSDWRLASIDELKTLYDPSSTRNTTALDRDQVINFGGQVSRDAAGATWTYHIVSGITLTGANVWSSTNDQYNDIKMWLFFSDGSAASVPTGFSRNMRALCVRPTGAANAADTSANHPAPSGAASQPAMSSTVQEYSSQCNAGDAKGCRMLAYSYSSGSGVAKDPDMALANYQKGCSMGDKQSCREAQYWRLKLSK